MDPNMYQMLLSLGTAASVFITIVALWLVFGAWLTRNYTEAADAYRKQYVFQLQFPDSPALVIGGYIFAVIALAGIMLLIGPLLAPVVLIIGYFAPRFVFTYFKQERQKVIDDVIPNVLQQLSANTKNIGSISLALQEVAQTAPEPMDYELTLISRQEQELKSFTKAMEQARGRIDTQWFDIVSAVLLTAEEKGGRISVALGNLSRVFVQLKAMQTRIDTATSQGRMSMKLMLAMPFVVVAIVYIVDPGLVALAVSNTAGKIMLGLAAFFYVLATGLAIWLSSVKI